MAKAPANETAPPRPPTQLMLVVTAEERSETALAAALAGGPVASVLVWTEGGDGRELVNRVQPLVALAQGAGAAALVRGDTLLVGRSGADGLHSDGDAEALEGAIADLQPDRIVGAGNLRSRNDAMEAAEAGADYVFFGNLTPGDTRQNGIELLMERAAWWQPIFLTPCVVYCPTLADAGPLAEAGADFLALSSAVFEHPAGPGEAVKAVNAAIAEVLARLEAEA